MIPRITTSRAGGIKRGDWDYQNLEAHNRALQIGCQISGDGLGECWLPVVFPENNEAGLGGE